MEQDENVTDIIKNILANENLIYQQNEQLLLLVIQQNQRIDEMYSIINRQSQAMNEINQKIQPLYLKLSDLEINTHINGDNVSNILDECKQLSNGLQDIGNKIDHLKIYKTVYEGDM